MPVIEKETLYHKRNKIEREDKLYKKNERRKARNRGIITLIILLVIISIFNMLSASFYTIYTNGMKPLIIHILYILLGFFFFIIASSINYKNYNKNKICAFFIGSSIFIFLFIIFASRISALENIVPHINGAIGWIRIGSFSIQPVEFLKIPFIIVVAHFLERCEKEKYSTIEILLNTLPIMGIYFICILFQKDLGTAIHYCGIFIFMLFMSRIKYKEIIGCFGVVLFLTTLFFYHVYKLEDLTGKSYKIRRVGSFLNGILKNEYDNSIGYQVGQSLIAFGSGGIAGKGYANGVQKYSYLPEIRTDFILASYGEEFGLLGMIILLIFFLLLFNITKRIAMETKDYFGKYLAIGLAGYLIIQVLINIYVALGLVPVFGIPMPLFSHGGTSILTVMTALGIVVNINNKGS